MRFDLALELLDDVRRLDAQLKESHRRIRVAIKASGTSLTGLYGVGPVIAATLIGYSGDITHFADRDAYATFNGTAPIEFSSGGRTVHRLSTRGSRKLNHALHIAAITQLRNPGTTGRIYVDRKVAEGKTKKEAAALTQASSLQRGVPPAGLRRPIAGPGGQSGTTRSLRDRLNTPERPALRRSHSRTHMNSTQPRRSTTARTVAPKMASKMGS